MRIFGYELTIKRDALPPGATVNAAGSARLNAIAAASATPIVAASAARPETRPSPGVLPATSTPFPIAPLRYQFQQGQNATWTPRQGRLPFEVLRNFADIVAAVRICIETRKDQIDALEWDIVPRDKQTTVDEGAVNAVRTFFQSPDQQMDFKTWVRAMIEEVLVTDALALYRRPTRGGDLYSLDQIDGATIKVLLDSDGKIPAAPHVAYRQVIYGYPVEDLTRDQLYYLPRTVRVAHPYGLSPTEGILLTVTSLLNREIFTTQYYADGNIPAGLGTLPKDWSAAQIAEYQQYWDDLIVGNGKERARIKWAPDGSKIEPFTTVTFDAKFDEWLYKVVCAAFGVPPPEVGLTGDVNKAAAGHQENLAYRRGVKPMCSYLKGFFDRVIAIDLKQPTLKFAWIGGEPEDKKSQAEVDKIQWETGQTSTDELRARDGKPMIGLGPIVMTSKGPVLVEDLIAGVDDDPDHSDANIPEGGAPSDDPDAGARAASGSAAASDLKKWRAVAIKSAKSGRAVRPFVSDEIPPAVHAYVAKALELIELDDAHVDVVASVVRTFAAADVLLRQHVAKASRLPKKRVSALARVMSAHFTDQGDALRTHVATELHV